MWSVIAGFGVAGNFAFYFVSIAQGSLAVAVTLMYCAPVFVYLVSFALKLESPTALKWAAIAVVMLGIVLLTQLYDIGASSVTPIGVVFLNQNLVGPQIFGMGLILVTVTALSVFSH
jgi:drug/metabolite transporter, DME family